MRFNNIHKSYAARFLRDLQFFGAVSVPYFLDWIQTDYTQIFLLQAWFVMWVVLLEIPTGVVADKYGRKASLILGILLFGADVLVFGFTQSLWVLYVAEFVGAIGTTLLSGADKALLYDSIIELGEGERSATYLSRYQAASTLGILVAFPLGSLIAGSTLLSYPYSLAFTFIIAGATSLLAVFFYLAMREPKRHRTEENAVRMGIEGLKQIRNDKSLRAFVLNSVLLSGVTFFIFWFYQPLSGNAGIDVAYYGFIGAGFNAFAALLLLNTERLEDWFGMKNLLFYSALIPGLLLVGVALVKNAFFVVCAILFIAGFKQLRKPILSDFINKQVQSTNRATILSSVSLLERLVIAILYPLVGTLADIALPYALGFLGVIALILTFVTKLEEVQLAPTP